MAPGTSATRRTARPPSSRPPASALARVTAAADAALRAADGAFPAALAALVVADFLLALAVAARVPYTEIDWQAYMEQVAQYRAGARDYRSIRGGTGPLVYPAAFLYVFSALARLPSTAAVQVVFAALHAAAVGLYATAYRRAFVVERRLRAAAPTPPAGTPSADAPPPPPPIATARAALLALFLPIAALPASRRVLSLYVLRFFNDGVEATVAAAALVLFCHNAWAAGCIVYSLAVGIKMNALLWAPGVAVLLVQARGPLGGAALIALCAAVQVALGAPFVAAGHAGAYVRKAFELDRAFLQKWSVNGAAYAADTFASAALSRGLLVVHLGALLVWGHTRWAAASGGLPGLVGLDRLRVWPSAARDARGGPSPPPPRSPPPPPPQRRGWWAWATAYPPRRLAAAHTLRTLLTANLLGVAAARTIHYQFYAWYWHSLPWLAVAAAGVPTPRDREGGGGDEGGAAAWAAAVAARLGVVAVIEVVYNVYPPRAAASMALHAAHAVLLVGLWRAPLPAVWEDGGGGEGGGRGGKAE